jgi:translocation and assembly module TamB
MRIVWKIVRTLLYLAAISGLLMVMLFLGISLYFQTEVGGERIGALVQDLLREQLGLSTVIGSIKVDVFNTAVTIEDLSLSDGKSAPIVSVGRIRVVINPLPILAGRLVIREVLVDRPQGHLVVENGKITNLPRFPAFDRKKPEGQSPLNLEVEVVTVRQGRFKVDAPGWMNAELRGFRLDLRRDKGLYYVAVATGKSMVSARGTQLKDVRIDLKGRLYDQGVELDRVTLRIAPDWMLNAAGSIRNLDHPVLDLTVSARLPMELAMLAAPDFPETKGVLNLQATAKGAFPRPQIAGELSVEKARVDSFGIGDVDLHFKFADGKLEASPLKVRSEAAKLDVTAVLSLFEEGIPIEGEVRLIRVELHRLLDMLNAHNDSRAELAASGIVRVRGRLVNETKMSLATDLSVTEFRVLDTSWKRNGQRPPVLALKAARVVTDGELSADGIKVRRGHVHFEDSTITIDGTSFTFSPEGGMHIIAASRDFDMQPVSPLAGFRLAGKGSINADINGPYSTPVIKGGVRFSGTEFEGFRAGEVSLDVLFKDDVLSFTGVKGQRGGMKYAGSLDLDFRRALEVRADLETADAPMQDAVAALNFKGVDSERTRGTVSFKGEIMGPPGGLAGEASLTVVDGKFYDQKVEKLVLELKSDGESVTLEKFAFSVGAGVLTATGYFTQNGLMDIRIKSEALRLKDIVYTSFKKYQIDSEVDVRATVGGSFDDPAVDLSLTLKDPTVGDHKLQQSYLDASLRKGRLDAKASFMGGALTASASGETGAKAPLRVTAEAKSLQWPLLLPSPGDIQGNLEASMEAEINISDPGKSFISLDMKSFDLRLPSFSMALKRHAVLVMKDRAFKLEPVEFTGDNVDFTIKSMGGALGLGNLTAQGKADLKLLELIGGEAFKAGGAVSFGITLISKRDALELGGSASLSAGMIAFRDFPHPISDISLKAYLSGSKIMVEDLRAQFAGGKLEGSGELDIGMISPARYRFNGYLKEANLRYPRIFPSRLSGNVTLDGDTSSMTLGGDITIESMVFSEEIQWDKLIAEMRRKRNTFSVFEKEKEFLKFDLGLHGGSGILVKNSLADAEFKVDLRLAGSTQRVGLLGTVTAIKGTLNLFGNQFVIRRASVQFSDRYRLAYAVDMQADSTCRDQNAGVDHPIKMEVSGSGSDIRVTYKDTYSPPFSESDVIMCMTLGTTSDQLSKGKDQYFGLLTSVTGIDSKVKSMVPIPIETFRLSQVYSDYSRMTVPVVQVTWKVTDNGRLSYQASLVDSSDQKIDMDYKLNRTSSLHFNWSNQSTLVSMGNLGLDLTLKWEF